MIQTILDIIGFFVCGFVGFVGGYLYRKCKEIENAADN